MKRLLMLSAIIFTIAASAYSANLVDMQVQTMGDTIHTAIPNALDIYIENDYLLGGMSLGFQVWSPDGASWVWNDVGGAGASGYVTTVLSSRMGDGSVFDMTGFLVTEQDIDESGRDTIMSGGVAMAVGLAPGPLEHMFSLHFTPFTSDPSVAKTLCFDSCFVPPSGAFVFVGAGGNANSPEVAWAPGGKCYPVRAIPQWCPEWDYGYIPTAMDVDHCGSGSVTLSATDMEDDDIMFQLGSVNGGGGTANVIDYGNGTCEVTYTPIPSDFGATITIVVETRDPWHQWGDCYPYTLNVNVTNNVPTIDCGADHNMGCNGTIIHKSDISASDIDACDVLTYSLISETPAFSMYGSVNALTGEYAVPTQWMDIGLHEVCIGVNDGFDIVECCFSVEVFGCEWYEVQIEKAHDVLQGHYVDVELTLNKGTEIMGGFDFLIGYDASALAFTEAALSDYLVDCGWEYFTYRYNWNGNCGNACPTGLLRLIGIAETNNGPNHPDYGCISMASAIATLTFFVSNDRTLECMYLPIRFFWDDCNDNSISSSSGDSLYVSDHVYEFEGTEITDPTFGFPTYFGIPDDPCMEGDKEVPIRYIDFINGGIDVVCADSIDARGDINVNGVANEIADAVMFTNYFINGLNAFGDHIEASIAASDVNADGIALSVADLVYQVRIITGDAPPYPKAIPESPVTISVQSGQVSYDSPVDIGAALLTFEVRGEIGLPQLGDGAATMDMKYDRNGNELRVLVYNIGSEMIPAGQNGLLTISGDVELTGAEFATYDGFGIDALVRNLPHHFAVNNYPNPFNPSTTISLALPESAAWSVEIFNVAGQMVNNYTGYSNAGTVKVFWNGTDNNGYPVASGIYLYRAQAGQQVLTRKMILMK